MAPDQAVDGIGPFSPTRRGNAPCPCGGSTEGLQAPPKWVGRSGRRRAALRRASHLLARRGASLILVSRYVPGGRTATTLAAGSVRFPLRTFTPAVVGAGLTWGTTSTLIGYLGGRAFADRPLLGLALGLGTSFLLAGGVELAQRLRSRSRTEGAGVVDVRDVEPAPDRGRVTERVA